MGGRRRSGIGGKVDSVSFSRLGHACTDQDIKRWPDESHGTKNHPQLKLSFQTLALVEVFFSL